MLKNVPQPVEAFMLRPLPGRRAAELRLVE
jgi:hypothetical protein